MREPRLLLPSSPSGVGRRIDAAWRRVAAWIDALLRSSPAGRSTLASAASVALVVVLLPIALLVILGLLVLFAMLAAALLLLGLVAGTFNRLVRGRPPADEPGRVNVRVIRSDARG